MNAYQEFILFRLREEFLIRVEAILVVAKAGRLPSAMHNYKLLAADTVRYQFVLKDQGCRSLLESLAFVDATGNIAERLFAAQGKLMIARRDGDARAKLSRLFRQGA